MEMSAVHASCDRSAVTVVSDIEHRRTLTIIAFRTSGLRRRRSPSFAISRAIHQLTVYRVFEGRRSARSVLVPSLLPVQESRIRNPAVGRSQFRHDLKTFLFAQEITFLFVHAAVTFSC